MRSRNNTFFATGTSVALYAFTSHGLRLALRLADIMEASVHVPLSLRAAEGCRSVSSRLCCFRSLAGLMRDQFHSFRCHIFVAASGIAVRAIAPHLRGKAHDPSVLVIDQQGRHVISLLSGHLGGGNAITEYVAGALGASPVITTATDVEDMPAIDVLARERGLIIADIGAVKTVSAAILAGRAVPLYDPCNFLGVRGGRWETFFSPPGENGSALPPFSAFACTAAEAEGSFPPSAPCVVVTEKPLARRHADWLVLHPPLHAGIGCRKGTSAREILFALEFTLVLHGLAPAALFSLASIEAKRSEKGLLECAVFLGTPLNLYSSARLAEFPVLSPSLKAREMFGVAGVCEPAALAAARDFGCREKLLAGKTVVRGVTVAVAASLPRGG